MRGWHIGASTPEPIISSEWASSSTTTVFGKPDKASLTTEPGLVEDSAPPAEDLPAKADRTTPPDLVSALADTDVTIHRPYSRPTPRRWQRPYIARIALADAGAAAVGKLVAAAVSGPARLPSNFALTLVFVAAWLTVLATGRTYETRWLGVGSTEYRRILYSAVGAFAVVAAVEAVRSEPMRYPTVLAVGLTTVLDLLARLLLRRRLYQARWRGRYMDRVVAVGSIDSIAHVVRTLTGEAHHGLEVVGACVVEGSAVAGRHAAVREILGVPVVGGLEDVSDAVLDTGSQVVLVAASGDLSPQMLRRLAWSLETLGSELIVSPGLVEVAGPRLTVRPYPSLPLLHVEQPRLSGTARVVKGFGDRLLAGVLLVLLSPVLVAIALLVMATSPGGAFFKQTRIGLGGRSFQVWKFRSMVSDADALIESLTTLNEKDEVLFKMRRDPRVTRLGAFLRRFSLDELPQLFNVVNGSMSLVGPRPPLPREVDDYGSDVRRRLLVKPGITGLWQVSGRSELSWRESVRLDLRYVENWTVGLDISILWRTLHAVVGGRGAY